MVVPVGSELNEGLGHERSLICWIGRRIVWWSLFVEPKTTMAAAMRRIERSTTGGARKARHAEG